MFATPKASGRPSLASQSFLSASFTGRRSLQTTPRSTPINSAKRAPRTEQILEETGEHVVTALNSPVPVQVQETLRTIRGNAECCVRLDKSGWAWLVADCKLLLWRHTSQQLTTQCIQLMLPPSETGSGWSADLIAIPKKAGENVLPLLASSPDGKLLYWTNVLRDMSISVEDSIPLSDSSAFSLTSVPYFPGCVLATSQTGLFMISPLSNSQLYIREVQIPRGMLSGFGRRVSSLFFGSGPPDLQETRRVVCKAGKDRGSFLFVLTNTHLQRWNLTETGEQMCYNVELQPLVKDAVLHNQWAESNTLVTTFLIDMQLVGDSVAILFALAVDGSTSAEYGLALLPNGLSDGAIPSIDRLIRLNYTTTYHPGSAESALLKYILHGSTRTLIIYNRHTALLVNIMNSTSGMPDMVTFPQPNSILGRGHTPSMLLLFTLHQGVVSVSSAAPHQSTNKPVPATPSLLSSSLLTTPTYRQSPFVKATSVLAPEASEEATEMIKKAFEVYFEGDMSSVDAICEEHFPPVSFASRLDTLGDLAVVRLSNLILDDPPLTSDSNWSEGGDPSSTPGGKSLILIYRLEQKLLAHNRYIHFLTDSSLIERLTCVTMRGQILQTRKVLCEHAEKIQAAISVRRTHNQFTDQVIRVALRGRQSSPLSKMEQFYTQLSCFEDLIPSLSVYQKETLPSLQSPRERIELVLSASSVLHTLLRDAILYRQSTAHMYQAGAVITPRDHAHTAPPGPNGVEEVPWTASDEIRRTLREQIDLLFTVCGEEAQGHDELNVWSLVVSLADILFNGFKVQIDSLKEFASETSHLSDVQKLFESDKRRTLSCLMDAGQYQHATELAERFEDFRVLVQLCEDTGNRGKLAEYMQRYKAQGFSEFLFKWYLDEGQLQQLLSFSDSFPQELASFLAPHPQLSWLHSLSVRDYGQAHKALKNMADREVQYVAKKKTLLSLSKLSLLASHSDDGTKDERMAELDNALQHIDYQQNIPQEAVELADMDFDLMPPLSPQRVIELYVSEDCGRANESSFINALEYINHAYPDRDCPECVDLRCYVWSQAILRDDWSQLSTDDPLGELQKTFFSTIILEGYNRGLDILPLLPDLNSLFSCHYLTEHGVSSQPTFKFLVRAGYEQLSRVQASMSGGFDRNTGQQRTETD